jgi:rare lipoprotein A
MRDGRTDASHGRSESGRREAVISPVSLESRSKPQVPLVSSVLRVGAALGVGLLVANCSSATQKMASRGGVDPKYGVSASPKVVADGDPVPKGGGRELVGKPYVVAGRLYTPRENPHYSAVGLASWYGPSFHGRLTANGEVFDLASISAAHPTMPLPSYIRVTNLTNGYSIIARVNDRGPYHGGRLIDVSQRVAEALNFRRVGTAKVKVDYVGRASTAGSDDEKLYASLRTDGGAAQLRGNPTIVASAEDEQPAPTPIVYRQPQPEPAPAPVVQRQPVQVQAMQYEAPVAAAPVAMAPVALAATAGRPAPGVPLPPDRPFDLGSARPAGAPALRAPVAGPVPMPIPRQANRLGGHGTSLFYAESEPELDSTVRKDDPLAGLIEQNFVPLNRRAQL